MNASAPVALPTLMQVIEISRPGGPEVLLPTQRPLPLPRAGEVLLRVVAAGVNRPDVQQRAGAYPPPPGASDLPGLEVAGHVVALGTDITCWQIGDEVCALCNGGGYAEYVAVPHGQCLPRPHGFSWVEAAALPENCFTVWVNVFERGGLRSDESFLVHGGSSGIGTIAIQLAHAFGARVFATAGSAEKCAVCVELGAERAIDYHHEDFVAAVREATGGRGIDLILDMVGGDYLARNLDALAVEGRLASIATQHGREATLDITRMMVKRLHLSGSTLRPRSSADKARIADGLRREVWPLLDSGRVRPRIHARFALAAAADAHRMMEAGKHIGKLVLLTSYAATDP
ncbi:MAG: NAD(P)H-quinone oxidoreductase [Dokdonella sp.]